MEYLECCGSLTYLKDGAGDGTRTRDVQPVKLSVSWEEPTELLG